MIFRSRGKAKALGVARSSVYYKPRPVSAEDLKLMRRLDELRLDHPFAGARMLRDLREGVGVGCRHVTTELCPNVGDGVNQAADF